MTDPSELPATFFSATRANPTPPDRPKPNGALVYGFLAWIALIVSLIAIGLAVAK